MDADDVLAAGTGPDARYKVPATEAQAQEDGRHKHQGEADQAHDGAQDAREDHADDHDHEQYRPRKLRRRGRGELLQARVEAVLLHDRLDQLGGV